MKNRTRRHLDKIQTYENAHNKPYSYIVDDYIKNQFTEDQYDAYNVAGSNPSALSLEISNFVYGITHLGSSWNYMQEKMQTSDLKNDEMELAKINEKLEELLRIQSYVDDAERANKLSEAIVSIGKDLRRRQANGETGEVYKQLYLAYLDAKSEYETIDKSLKDREEFYKTEGKRSDNIRWMLYDPDKDSMSATEVFHNTLASDKGWYTDGTVSKNADNIANNILGLPENIINSLWSGIGKILPDREQIERNYGKNNPFANFIEGLPRGEFTRRYIGKTDSYDRSTDRWFVSAREGSSVRLNILNKLNQEREYLNKRKAEKEQDVHYDEDVLKNGTWFYNPKGIDEKFRQIAENKQLNYGFFSFLNPANLPYSFSELGSSFSSLSSMALSMASDAGIQYAVKKISSKVLGGPVAALSAASDISEITTAVNNLDRARDVAKNIDMFGKAAALGSSIYFTNQMRRNETNNEAMEAWVNRTIQELYNRGINSENIVREISDKLPQYGVDPSYLSASDIIEKSIAYNIKTSDSRFEDVKEQTRRGLNELINKNNALAFMDYIEVLPFLSYQGSMFKKAFGYKNLKPRYSRFDRKDGNWIIPKGSIINGNEIAALARWNGMVTSNPELLKAMDPSVTAFIGRKIEKAANKIFKSPAKRKMFADASNFLTRKAAKMFPLMTKEGIEEGQQHLMQRAYEQGYYDSYDKDQSMFDIPSLFDDLMLGGDAVAAFMGGSFGDPDDDTRQLMSAMATGAMTAMWFRAPHTIGTNLLSQNQKRKLAEKGYDFLNPEADNIRGLFSLLKDDRILGNMISESQLSAQDDQHTGIFFDAFKRGRTYNQLKENLQEFKKYKGPGVEDLFIDDDQQILDVAYGLYGADFNLQELGIEKNSQAHKFYVLDGVNVILKARRGELLTREDSEKYQELKTSFMNRVSDITEKVLNNVPESEISPEDKEIYDEISRIRDDEQVRNDAELIARANVSDDELRKEALENLKLTENDLKTRGRTTLKQRKAVEKNKKNLEAEIKRLREEKYNPEEDLDVSDTVRRLAQSKYETLLSYQHLVTYDFLRKYAQDRSKMLSFIRKEFGIPVEPDVLDGVVNYLNNTYGRAYGEEMTLLLELQQKLKDAAEKDGILISEADYNRLLESVRSTKNIPQDIKSFIVNKVINEAVSAVMRNAAQAYMFGLANPNQLRLLQRLLSWNQLSPEQKLAIVEDEKKNNKDITEDQVKLMYSKRRREYYKKMNEYRKQWDDLNQKINKVSAEGVDDETIKNLIRVERDASLLYILRRLQNKIDRSISAHYDRTKHNLSLLTDLESFKYDEKSLPYLQLQSSQNTKSDETLQPETKLDETVDVKPVDETIDDSKSDETLLPETKSDEVLNNDKSDESDVSEQERNLRSQYGFGQDPDEVNRVGKSDETVNNDKSDERQDDSDRQDTSDNNNTLIDEEDPLNPEQIPDNFGSNVNDDVDELEDNSLENRTKSDENADDTKLDETEENTAESPDYIRFKNVKQHLVANTEQAKFDYLSRTLFYQPFKIDKDGKRIPNEEVPELKIGNTPVKLLDDAQLKSPAELSRKLVQKGWFAKTKKYFIITADVDHVDMTNPDSLNVVMIIQDGKDAYAVFMRGLSEHWSDKQNINRTAPKYSRREQLLESLREMHTRDEFKLPLDSSDPTYNEILRKREDIYYEEANYIYQNLTGDVYVGKTPEDWLKRKSILKRWISEQPQSVFFEILNRQRSRMSKAGKRIMTEERIREQMDALREARNAIIEQCVSKDDNGEYMLLTDGYKLVIPIDGDVVISNGSYNDQTDEYGRPIFRNCTDTDMGMSKDIEELTQLIFKDEVRIGYGVGERVQDESLVGAILNIDPQKVDNDDWDIHVANGKSGKLYIILKGPSGKDTAVQLRERHFDGGNKNILPDDITEAFDQDGRLKAGATPSIAEFILRALVGNIHADVFGQFIGQSILQELVSLLIHTGEDTAVSKKTSTRKPWLGRKLLWYDSSKKQLHIAMSTKDNPYPIRQYISYDLLFGPNSSESLRKKVIATIARNFHWNTEKDDMAYDMVSQYPKLFEYLKQQFKKSDTVSILGIKDLTFKKSDFFKEDGSKKSVSQIAWMILSEKLMTDKGDTVFRDPFVFCNGIGKSSKRDDAQYKAALKQRNKLLKQNKSNEQKSILKKQRKSDNNPSVSQPVTRLSILSVREERQSKVNEILASRMPYNRKIQKIIDVYTQYGATDILKSEDYSIRGRIISYFSGKVSKFIAYENYEKDGVTIMGAKAFGVTDPSNAAKRYFKQGGVGFEKLVEDIINYINSETSQTDDEHYVDPSEVMTELAAVLNDLLSGTIEFLGFLDKLAQQENYLKGLEDAIEIPDEAEADNKTDLAPTIDSLIENALNDFLAAYGKDARDKVLAQLGGAKEALSAKGYKNAFLINIGNFDPLASESEWETQLNKKLQSIPGVKDVLFKSDDINSLVNGEDVLIYLESEDGSKRIIQTFATKIDNIISKVGGINGVYSSKRGNFKQLDVEDSRKFLQECLGLKSSQIVVVDGVLKTASNSEVYGVTMLAADTLSGVLDIPLVVMSKSGKRGMLYHEGFHYVNLLLHDKNTRRDIYNEYRRTHLWARRASDKKVEELLAESFRKYARRNTETTISAKIKKFFQNILDFIFLSRKTSLIRHLYEDILNKKYAGLQIDPESLKEFRKAYSEGVYMDVGIPSQRRDVMDKFKHIKDYKTYYAIAESLARSYVAFTLRNTAEQTIKNSKNSLSRFLKTLDEKTMFDDNREYIEDILNNPEGFSDIIQDVLKKYGFIGKIVKMSDDQQTEYDGKFDMDHFEVSAKDNVAHRAKLFLGCIPEYEYRNGELVQIYDEYTHMPRYYEYDQSYNNAVRQLANCETYEEMYKKVKELSKKVAYFASLSKQLDSISNDVELQSQIYAALKMQSPNITFTEIGQSLQEKAEKKYKKAEKDDESTETMSSDDHGVNNIQKLILNQQREIIIRDDNTLRATRAMMRSWSSNLFSRGMFVYNAKTKTNHISSKYLNKLKAKHLLITTLLQDVDRNTSDLLKNRTKFDEKIREIKQNILSLFDEMGIVYDMQTLDTYVMSSMKYEDYDNPLKILDRLKGIVGYKAKAREIKTGSIKFLLQLFDKNAPSLTNPQGNTKYEWQNLWKDGVSFTKTYEGFGPKSQIYLMARIYSIVNPNPRELSVRTPGGKMRYPTNLNNTVSDVIRWMGNNNEGFLDKMLATPYAKHSRLLNIAKDILGDFRVKDDLRFKIGLYSGMEDRQNGDNGDYFQITPLDDIINKMIYLNGTDTHSPALVFPTMADKKTFYFLSLTSLSGNREIAKERFKIPHDSLTITGESKNGFIRKQRFSNDTLAMFAGYFEDELETLELYYSRKNIQDLVNNPANLKKNYHGSVKNGRLQFGGNGGMFRYFYDLMRFNDNNNAETSGRIINMNQMLLAEYELQKSIEDPNSDDSVSWLREKDPNTGELLDLDGFELVRKRLKEIRKEFFNEDGSANIQLYDDINRLLFNRIIDACGYDFRTDRVFAGGLNSGDTLLLVFGQKLGSRCIPNQILNQYRKQLSEDGIVYAEKSVSEETLKIRQQLKDQILNNQSLSEEEKKKQIEDLQKSFDRYDNVIKNEDIVLSAVGNYVVGQMMSIIELEKVIFGDPAFYKWLYFTEKDIKLQAMRQLGLKESDLNTDENKKALLDEIDRVTKFNMKNPVTGETIEVAVDILNEKDSDKIKRLGGVLSPGSEIRRDYTPEILSKFPELTSTKYTIANIADIDAKSLYYDECVLRFKKQRVANFIRQHSTDPDIVKLTHTEVVVEYIDEPVVKYQTKRVTRTEAGNNKRTLYLFEDNLDRSSDNIGGFVKDDSWYSKKYNKDKKKTLSYGKNDASRIRGLQNAAPISTRLNSAGQQITKDQLEEFKRQVDDEFKTIYFLWSTGNYNNVKFVANEHNILDSIENEDAKQYVKDKLDKLTLDFGTRRTSQTTNKYLHKAIDAIYNNDDYFNSVFNGLEESIRDEIQMQAEKSAAAYDDINVSDAQVMIRPECYRKVRLGLGEWSIKEYDINYYGSDGKLHTTLYSDEKAYRILEGDDSWMTDEEKSAIVRNFEAYPLKMSFFQNLPKVLGEENTLAVPVYNKMAIFPVFKFMYTSKTGRLIYERMNLKDNELDMIAFESAVKVGLGKNIYSPFGKNTTSLSTLDDLLNSKSSRYISSEDWTVKLNVKDGKLLPVEILDLSGLRMQLNTESHEDVVRNIGTQMFKILFSNINPDEQYTFSDGSKLFGRLIRENIMSSINKLTAFGVRDLKREFYNADGTSVNESKVAEYVLEIFQNNGVGKTTEEILMKGGVASSTTPRRLLEQSVSAMINRKVVDIPTNGGSAILQSIFGLVSFNKNEIKTNVDYSSSEYIPNNGKEPEWLRKDGSMGVLLSLNFFRHVVPKQYQHTDMDMRQWLINHDYIGGFKKHITVKTNVGAFMTDKLDSNLVEWDVYNTPWKDDKSKTKRVLKIWLKGQKEKGWFEVVADTNFENTKFDGHYSVHFKTNTGKYGNEDTQASTKEERSVLFQLLANVIPEGASVSTWGSVSKGGIYGLDRLARENGWVRSAYHRNVTSKETGEEIKIPVFIKPLQEDEYVTYKNDSDERIARTMFTSVDSVGFSPVLVNKLKQAGFENLGDMCKITKKMFKNELHRAGVKISDEDIDMIGRLLEEFSIPFGTQKPIKIRLQSNPKPFGVGYRIPTQGISSTFAFTVEDVLPRNVGDLIIVPREFTGQTGSDFDVDKIYLATKSFFAGKMESGDSLGGVRNDLLLTYIELLTNNKNFSNARASIDTITDKIKKEILPLLRNKTNAYASSMYELTPHFQEQRKKEFSTGKDGIGPFALSITNLALTQFANITFDYPEDNMGEYGFHLGDLDRSVGLGKELGGDDELIADWLSAMVNAHVDVAKDPYIFALNINKATYKMANFLFRAGKGHNTLLFLAQPALKEYALEVISSGGIYSGTVDTIQREEWDSQILNRKIELYKKLVDDEYLRLYGDGIVKNNIDLTAASKIKDLIDRLHSGKDVRWHTILNDDKYHMLSDGLSTKDRLKYLIIQEFTLRAFKKLTGYANKLSELVQVSQVDTKKFGNDTATHLNFLNTLGIFTRGISGEKFTLTVEYNGIPPREQDNATALLHYFYDSYLNDKLFAALNHYDEILSTQLITATNMYKKVFVDVMTNIAGESSVDGCYKKQSNQDRVRAIGQAVDNIIRTLTLFQFAKPIILPSEKYSGPIDFTFGGDRKALLKNFFRIMNGDPKAQAGSYENLSLFSNISKLILDINDNPKSSDYTGLSNANGVLDNALLEFLRPMPATKEREIPTMLFSRFKVGITETEKSQITSSFEFMLTHKNERVRRIARDIAIYAYYSTYDTSIASSFFDLVPYDYRCQYDNAIRDGLRAYRQGLTVDSDDITDMICRNFYYDHNIVPVYTKKPNDPGKIEVFGLNVIGAMVPSYVITDRADSAYIKMLDSKSKLYYLYKHTDTVIMYTEDGKVIRAVPIYTMVSKYGLHSGNTHIYEFINNSDKSVFSSNDLPATITYDMEMKIRGTMAKSEKKAKSFKIKKHQLSDQSLNIYKYEPKENIGGYELIESLGTNIEARDFSDFNANLDISKDQLILLLVAVNNGDNESKVLSFSGTPNVKPSQSYIQKYINEQLNKYESRILDSSIYSSRELKIKKFKQRLENVAEHNATLRYIREYLHDLYTDLLLNGLNISKFVVNVEDEIGKEVLKMLIFDARVEPSSVTVLSSEKLSSEQILEILKDQQNVLSLEELELLDKEQMLMEEVKLVLPEAPEQPELNVAKPNTTEDSVKNQEKDNTSSSESQDDSKNSDEDYKSVRDVYFDDNAEAPSNDDIIAAILKNNKKSSC